MRSGSLLLLGVVVAIAGCQRTDPPVVVIVSPEREATPEPVVPRRETRPDDGELALLSTLRDAKATHRRTALTKVQSEHTKSAALARQVLAMAQDVRDPDHLDAIATLGHLPSSQEGIDALLILANTGAKEERVRALRALGQLDPNSAKVQVTLRRALSDDSAEIRLAAVDAVGRQGKEGIPTLVQTLAHPDEHLRVAAVEKLGTLGSAALDAYPALTRLTREDPAQRVRQSAEVALRRIQPTDEVR